MSIKRILLTAASGTLLGFIGLFTMPAHADVGPMLAPSEGGILRAGATTDIAMKSEKVTLTYAAPTGPANNPVMRAHVVAQFTMSNPATAPKSLTVFFPDDDNQYLENYPSDIHISNFSVNGNKQTGSLVDMPSGFGDGSTVKAYKWNQTFAAGDSTLTVEYDTLARTRFGVFALTYVLGSGRNWAGAIGSGEVDFVLPENLPDYAVTGKINLMRSNKLGYTVSGKTIKVNFTNYEPAATDAIVIGVANPTDIAKIEKLRQATPATFDTTLAVAAAIRSISAGGHCFMCVEPAGQQASAYYEKALSLATTKDQLEAALGSYAYNGFTADSTLAHLYDLLSFMKTHPYCQSTDADCNGNTMEFARETIMGQVPADYRTNFLALYACRLRPFDFAHATLVEDYADKRIDSCPTLTAAQAQSQPQAQNNTGASKPANAVNWSQIWMAAGGVFAAVVIAIVAIVVARRHHKKALTKAPAERSEPQKQEPKDQK